MILTRAFTRAALAAALLLPVTARAQAGSGPTPEGTVIKNKVTVTYTDANNNSYAAVTDEVSVTVGFLAGVDVSSAATVTPNSPSSNNTLTVTLANVGNGDDQITISVSADAALTITGYTFGASTYADLAALNAVLGATTLTAGASHTVDIIYDVAAAKGGATLPITITGTSQRSASTSDAATTNVVPPAAYGVAVTPKAAAVDRLPSNGTQYTVDFTVQNNSNTQETFDLSGATEGLGTVAIVSVHGVASTSATATIAAGATQTVTVVYTVANVAAGSAEKITLAATSQGDATTTDSGDLTVTVIKAALTIAKQAYRDNQATLITAADQVLPGDYIQYKITVTNTGRADATQVKISDALPSEVTYVSAAGDLAGWTIAESGGTVTADLTGALAQSNSRFIWVRVRIK